MNGKSVVVLGSIPLATSVIRRLLDAGCNLLGVVHEPQVRDYIDWVDEPCVAEYVRIHGIRRLSIEEIAELAPQSMDLAFSVRAPYILPPQVLIVFREGVVNFHGGPLPELRGVNCANFSILNELGYSAGTLHYMEPTVDTGPIICQQRFPIDADATAHDVFLATQRALFEAFELAIDDLLSGNVNATSQPVLIDEAATMQYFGRKALDEYRVVSADETIEAEQLHRRARAFDFPGHRPASLLTHDGQEVFFTTRPDFAGEWAAKNRWRALQEKAFGHSVFASQRLPPQTPTERLSNLSRALDVDLRVKRDDLLGAGGGNKERKAREVFSAAATRGHRAVVTTGALSSNHCRVVAQWAAKLGWSCHLVLHGTQDASVFHPNVAIMRTLGASIEVVPETQVASCMNAAIAEYKRDRLHPLYLPGGGHCVEGTAAYVAAALEAHLQWNQMNWQPDFLVIPSGTGSTQAGLAIGLAATAPETKIIGVSVARERGRGTGAVSAAATEWLHAAQVKRLVPRIDFRDRWTFGGYAAVSEDVRQAITITASQEGLLLDTTYTGKAMAALFDLVHEKEIQSGSRILFWHTGGIVNLISDVVTGEDAVGESL